MKELFIIFGESELMEVIEDVIYNEDLCEDNLDYIREKDLDIKHKLYSDKEIKAYIQALNDMPRTCQQNYLILTGEQVDILDRIQEEE